MRVAFMAATAALGGLLFGYDTGVISGALLFLRQAFHLSALMLGVVTSLALAGAALGAALAGPAADRYGRRTILIATAAIFVIGGLVSALASSLSVLLVGRLVVGLGIGGASMLTPLYLAEIAPARERGALVSLSQLAVTVGILVAYLVGYAFAAAGAWRWMLGIGAAPGLLLAVGMILLPESPRWLAATAVSMKQGERYSGCEEKRPASSRSWHGSEPTCIPMLKHRRRTGSLTARRDFRSSWGSGSLCSNR